MKLRGLVSDLLHFPAGSKNILALVVTALLLASIPVLAFDSPSADDEVRSLIKKAAKLSRDSSYAEAETLLRRAVEIDPNRSEAKVELAYVLVKERRLLDAYDIVLPVLERDRNDSHAAAVMGMTLLAAGRFGEARAFFSSAITLNRKEHLALAGMGMLNFYENHIDEGLQYLMTALDHKPDEPDYLFASAQAAGRAERYSLAAQQYERFLSEAGKVDADRRDRIRGLIKFLKILGDVVGQGGTLYANDGPDQTSVPFELEGDRPIIRLRIDDKTEPLRFVLDTGSGISVVSDETAKRLKIHPVTKGGFARGIGGDGRFAIVYGLLRKVSIGNISIRNVPVYMRKFQDPTQHVDGYIGLALISKFLATIDYGNQTFSLTKKSVDTLEFQKNDLSLPLRLTSSGFLSGEVQLEGMDTMLNFIVDTGASVSVISNRVAKTDGISPFVSDEKMRVIGSAGITDDVASFILPRITFGPNTRTSIKAVALDLDIINEASGFEQAGILGGNFLKNYRLTFDFKNSKVFFEAIKPEN
jgi:tetratricopeptide (TPR) repeat protein